MAVPKRRTSKSRKRLRRTHWKLTLPAVSTCAHCGQPTIPHRVCPGCGFYKGRQVIEPAEV